MLVQVERTLVRIPHNGISLLWTYKVGARMPIIQMQKPRLWKLNTWSKVMEQEVLEFACGWKRGSPKSKGLAQVPPEDSNTGDLPGLPYKPKGRVASSGSGPDLVGRHGPAANDSASEQPPCLAKFSGCVGMEGVSAHPGATAQAWRAV